MKTCAGCNFAKNSDNTRFCLGCGAELSKNPDQAAPARAATATPQQAQHSLLEEANSTGIFHSDIERQSSWTRIAVKKDVEIFRVILRPYQRKNNSESESTPLLGLCP